MLVTVHSELDSLLLGGRSSLRHGLHNFEALEIREGCIGARSRALLLVLHLPFSVDEGESVVANASSSHKAVLGVVVFIERVLHMVGARGRDVKLTHSEAIISLRDGKLRLISCSGVDNVGADDVRVLVVARTRKLLGLL